MNECKSCKAFYKGDICPWCRRPARVENACNCGNDTIHISHPTNNPTQIVNSPQPKIPPVSEYTWVANFFLCLLLGVFGAHRMYVGKEFTGCLYMVTLGFLGIGVIIDLIRILTFTWTDCYGIRIVPRWMSRRRLRKALASAS
jgi:TM2 domain-containing membrane protein YozV